MNFSMIGTGNQIYFVHLHKIIGNSALCHCQDAMIYEYMYSTVSTLQSTLYTVCSSRARRMKGRGETRNAELGEEQRREKCRAERRAAQIEVQRSRGTEPAQRRRGTKPKHRQSFVQEKRKRKRELELAGSALLYSIYCIQGAHSECVREVIVATRT